MRGLAGFVVSLSCLCFAFAGCVQIGTDTGGGSGAGGTSGAGPTSANDGSDAGGGTNCGRDSTGSVTLCEEIDACPGLGVDPSAYAGCGFRLGGAAPIDLECVCGDALCPIGVASSCAQAAQLLAAQNVLTVCEQAGAGRCLPLGTGGDASSGSCTPACQSECAGVPDCLVTCGC
jgi:hypothetical protein